MSESEPQNLSEKMYGTPEERAEREAPRRLNAATLEAHRHELEMARATKPGRQDVPSFGTKRSTASGSLGVYELRADVPVCEEFPTAKAALDALIEFTDTLAGRYPMPDGYVRAK